MGPSDRLGAADRDGVLDLLRLGDSGGQLPAAMLACSGVSLAPTSNELVLGRPDSAAPEGLEAIGVVLFLRVVLTPGELSAVELGRSPGSIVVLRVLFVTFFFGVSALGLLGREALAFLVRSCIRFPSDAAEAADAAFWEAWAAATAV